MKKLKLFTCLILAITLASNFISCGRSDQPADSSETLEETTPEPISDTESEAETEPEVPFTISSEELYDMLMANKSVWEREEMVSGTLINLDFEGMPEFLLMHKGYSPSLTIFKFDGETLKEIKTIENIYAEGVFAEFRAILPYTDENGVKRWVIPYVTYPDDTYHDYYLSAFDFTGDSISETVRFSCRIYSSDYSREGYEGYPYLNTEFYIDGVEHTASQDKLDEFKIELDRLMREYDEDMSNGYVGYLPWGCGGYYPNPSQSEWEDLKMEFLNGLLSVEPAYDLFPNIDSTYIWYDIENSWHLEQNIEPSLKRLCDAYCTEDEEYLRTLDLFYDNGGGICKPVIYLYPTEPTDISVSIDFPDGGYFTCTYPDYGSGWSVTAYPDGTVINKADGLEYSYLYWEGEGHVNWDFSSGFIVKGSDTAMFLREKLAYLGLTPREYNEFIVYWLPLMQNNSYNLITFQTTAYEESALLHISPEPDSILRVFMAYVPLDNPIEIPEQKLEHFERKGFSVIEWGGTCVN